MKDAQQSIAGEAFGGHLVTKRFACYDLAAAWLTLTHIYNVCLLIIDINRVFKVKCNSDYIVVVVVVVVVVAVVVE